ncbi:MAG: MFS transporter [Verrucomicrobia bacterium]|nr:MFS transporter [Verrucomicrobiota bacterium]
MKNFFSVVRGLTAAPDTSDTAILRQKTQRLSLWEGSFWSVMWGFGETYIAPFALFLGAGNLAMAFVGTGPVLTAAIAQLAGSASLDRIGRRNPIILTGTLIQALAYLPLFILPILLPAASQIPALLLTITVCFFAFGFSAPPWMSLMGDVVDQADRGRYFSNRTRITMSVMVVSMLLAGWIMNRWKLLGHPVVGFGFLFFIACLARLIGACFMRRHYDAPIQKAQEDEYFSFLDFVRATPRSNFARFTFAIALINGTVQISGPFFAVYMLRDLHWSYLQFTLSISVFLLSQTLFVRWWGALSDRHGNRSILIATSCIAPLLPLIWLATSNYTVLLLGQILSGACWSGFTLASSNFVYDAVSQPKRARAFSYYNLVNGLFSVAGGVLIGAPLAEHLPSELHIGAAHIVFRSSLPLVFLISAVARTLAAGIMMPSFREVRAAEPISTVRILWRLGIGQPLLETADRFSNFWKN